MAQYSMTEMLSGRSLAADADAQDIRRRLSEFGAIIPGGATVAELQNMLDGYILKQSSKPAPVNPATLRDLEHTQMLDAQRSIADITAEIRFYKAQTVSNIIEIGKRLIEAKEQLSHGAWGNWLENEVEFSQRTANRFMQIANEYSNAQTSAFLNYSQLVELLAVPAEEREGFIEAKHVVNGEEKTVADMSARELQRVIAELKEAKTQSDQHKASAESERTRREAAEREKQRAQQELEQLQKRPIDVAVAEVSQADIELYLQQGRDEARAAFKATVPAVLQNPQDQFCALLDGAVTALQASAAYVSYKERRKVFRVAQERLNRAILQLDKAEMELDAQSRGQGYNLDDMDF